MINLVWKRGEHNSQERGSFPSLYEAFLTRFKEAFRGLERRDILDMKMRNTHSGIICTRRFIVDRRIILPAGTGGSQRNGFHNQMVTILFNDDEHLRK